MEQQLLEEWCPEYVTPSVVGKYCGVSKVTVLRWIEKEALTAFRLPAGHYRTHRDDFDKFLVKHGIPIHRQTLNQNKEVIKV